MSLDDAAKWATVVYTAVAIFQFIVVVMAAIYAKGQIGEATRSRDLMATGELIRQIGDTEVRQIRFDLLHTSPSEADPQKIRRIAVAYDRIAYLTRQKLLPESALFAWQADEIGRLWDVVKPTVVRIRQEESRPHYCVQFEWLATNWLPAMARRAAG